MYFAWDGQNALERLLDHIVEAVLLLILHLPADLLVLVLTVWRLGEVLLQALHPLS